MDGIATARTTEQELKPEDVNTFCDELINRLKDHFVQFRESLKSIE